MAFLSGGLVATSTANQASFSTPNLVPISGSLMLVFVTTTALATVGALTNSDGLVFSLVMSTTKNAGADGQHLFVADTFSRNVSQNLSYAQAAGWTGIQIAVAQASVITRTGLAAIRQVAVAANQGAGTPAPAFSAAALTGNPCLGCIFNGTNPATMTPPTSWNELADDGQILPSSGIEVASIDSGFTGTTVTRGSASSAFSAMIAEIEARPPVSRFFYEMIGKGASV